MTGPNGNGNNFTVEQADDAAQRAHPGEIAAGPQRMDFGQGSFASAAGRAATIKSRADIAGTVLFSTQKSPSWVSCSLRRAMLAQEPGERLFRRAGARAALGNLRRRHFGRHRHAHGEAAGAMIGPRTGGV